MESRFREPLIAIVRREMTMDKQVVIAAVALKELDREMRLRETVTQPAIDYYLRGGLVGVAKMIGLLGLVVVSVFRSGSPFWVAASVVIGFIALAEVARQTERLNALSKLLESDKIKPVYGMHDRRQGDGEPRNAADSR